MSEEIGRYRAAVVQALRQMASVEGELARRDEARGALEVAAMHEHGEICLREAARAIEAMRSE